MKKHLLSCLILASFQVTTAHAQTLKEAIQLTLDENPEVQESRSARSVYEQQIDQATAAYLPSLDISSGYGFDQANTPSTRNARGSNVKQYGRFESSAKFRQLIFDGFGTPYEIDRFTAKTNAQAYTVFGKSEMIGLQGVQFYIGVLKAQANLDLAQKNLDMHKGFYEQIKLRTAQGVGRQSDLDQATGRLANAESNVKSEEGNYRDAESTFNRLIGILPKDLSDAPVPDSSKGEIPDSMDKAIELALSGHPLLKAADFDVDEAAAQHDVAKAPFYPLVTLEAGYDNNHNIAGVQGLNEELIAMMRVKYNLLSGGKDMARLSETAYAMTQAKNVRDTTYRQIIESIRLSWVAYQTLNRQMDFFKSHRDSTYKTLEAYKKQFNIGQRTLLDLLDTTNEAYQADLSYVDAKYNELAARYRILAGMGKLNEYLGTTIPEESRPLPGAELRERPKAEDTKTEVSKAEEPKKAESKSEPSTEPKAESKVEPVESKTTEPASK